MEAEAKTSRPVKGMGVKSMVKFAREVGGEEGFARLMDSLDEEDRELLSGTILPTDRFSEKTNQNLINGIVKTILDGNPERAVEIGTFLIDEGLNIAYKMFFKLGNPGWIISKGSLLWKMYHEVGSLEITDAQPRSCQARLTFPYLDVAFCRVIVGCILRALELSGAERVNVQHETCVAKGDDVCTYNVKWL